jgi:hypothetical protein
MYLECIMCGRVDPDGCSCSAGYEYAIKQKLGKEAYKRLCDAEHRASEAEYKARTANERKQLIEYKLSSVKSRLASAMQMLKDKKIGDIDIKYVACLLDTLTCINAALDGL